MSNTKRVSRGVHEAFSAFLKQWVDGAHGGNQSKAAKDLGVTQSHISALVGGNRGPGLNVLIFMRDKTGKSIDEMLGLAAHPIKTPPDLDAVRKLLRDEYGLEPRLRPT